MLKMGTMVTVSTFRVPFSDIEHPFLFSLHPYLDFLFNQIICLPPFTMCPSSWSLCVWLYAWCWGWSEVILPVGPGFSSNGDIGW